MTLRAIPKNAKAKWDLNPPTRRSVLSGTSSKFVLGESPCFHLAPRLISTNGGAGTAMVFP
jgi:hypothetical protein